MPSDCLFCRIARCEVHAHEVFRNDRLLAFLDIGPIRPGHVQIIPLAHYDDFETLPAETARDIMTLGQQIAGCQKTLLGVERVAFLFTGGDIPHAHAHLVPMVEKTDITSERYIVQKSLTYAPIPRPPEDSLTDMASRLAAALHASWG